MRQLLQPAMVMGATDAAGGALAANSRAMVQLGPAADLHHHALAARAG